jgi:hypothetical protein
MLRILSDALFLLTKSWPYESSIKFFIADIQIFFNAKTPIYLEMKKFLNVLSVFMRQSRMKKIQTILVFYKLF